jgi:Fe-S cluster assembly protein SufD
MTAVAEQTAAWLANFTQQQPAAPWVQELREAAFRRFSELGLPTTHDEEWRFTNVAPIARTRFRPAGEPGYWSLPETENIRLTFLNGVLVERPEELPEGVRVGTLRDDPEAARKYLARYAQYDSHAFAALNTAFLNDGALVRVARGTVVERPIEIVYLAGSSGEPTVTFPRTLALVGPGAQCAIVESFAGAGGAYFTNAVTEVVAAEGAVVDHYKVQQEGPAAFHVAAMHAQLGHSANFSATSISLGGALVRNDVNAILSEGAEATLNGLYIVNGTQHVDNHTTIDHAMPHGTSHELYKGILDGKSSAVFNGRIIVRKDAQKTDSKQTNKNLVLSEDAVIDTKPELQIFADDVRCTHGATIGQLDAESLFYMQSRGIGKKEARSLLTYAFAQDVVDRIKVRGLRDSLERILIEKFHERPE